jgi:inner membrane protein
MDSITQIALGAAVGEALLGKKIAYRASLWGAICGTLPDLDNFIPYQDAVAAVTYHRSFSHSLLFLAVLTPIMAWLIQYIHPQLNVKRSQWLLLVYGVFATHVLLDGFTVYGTQLLWPFVDFPFSWSTIFIIDPAYTLPLIVGVISVLCIARHKNLGYTINHAGLVLSSLYLIWTVGAKFYVDHKMIAALQNQGIRYEKISSTPTPFNTVLWRFVVMDSDGYFEAYYSVLDDNNTIEFTHYQDQKTLLKGLEEHWPVQRLQWFTHGFYSVMRIQDEIVISDLRMGLEPNYGFRYRVATFDRNKKIPLTSTRLPSSFQGEQLGSIWNRVFNPI